MYVDDLRTRFPGVVEEWERQRDAALADGEPEDNWPAFDNPMGVRWWLQQEAAIADDFAMRAGPESDIYHNEMMLRDYCLGAEDMLRELIMLGDGGYDTEE